MERQTESIKIYRTTYEDVRRIAREEGKKIFRVLEEAVKHYIESRKAEKQ